MRRVFLLVLTFVFLLLSNLGFSQDVEEKQPTFVGEFFDVKVTLDNYIFVRNSIAVFGNKFGPQPRTEEELEDIAWDQLLMSFEAFRRGIEVTQEEVDEEVDKILKAEKVKFNRKEDKEAYEEWVKNKTNEPVGIFEGQLKHLIQLTKLRNQVMESVDPPISEEEAFDEFLNEHNNLGVELAKFEDLANAEAFYKKVKRQPKYWDKEKKKKPDAFKRPGNVSLEFLIDIWGFPKEACYEMMDTEIGDFHKPEPIYKDYAVFKILAKRKADKENFPKVKESYYEQVKNKKKFEALKTWFENLKKDANIVIYQNS